MYKEQKEQEHIFIEKQKRYNQIKNPRVGDFIKQNKKYYRIAYIWKYETRPYTYQTESGGGSYYLGDKYMSMSGSLNSGFQAQPKDLKLLKETKEGWIWFFKNKLAMAYNGINFKMNMRVYSIPKSFKHEE